MTAKQWLQDHPEAAQWAKTTYDSFPGRQKHGVWQAIFQGLKDRGCPCSLNAIRIVMTDRDMVPVESKNTIGTDKAYAETSSEGAAVSSVPQGQANGLHVKKLHVHVPPPIPPKPVSKLLTAVVYGDCHIPFQDDAALRVVAQIIRVVQPDVLCCDGDLLDAYHLSRFDTNPKRMHRLQDEIDAARQHLAAFRLLAPQARYVYLEGNHEDRLRRALWSMPPHAKALTELNAVSDALTWPKLLGLEDLGIEFYPYGEQSKAKILPKWILKHGSVVRKLSAYTARAEWEKYGKSGSSGHTHRLGLFMHRDHNGSHCWVETGCTCVLNPEYAEDPDWMHGCLVLTFEPETGAFQAEPVYIHNGTAVFRNEWIDAR